MDSVNGFYQIEDFILSKPITPPYFLIVAGLFICLTSGLAFWISLSQQLGYWRRNLSPTSLTRWAKLQLSIPFAGTAIGLCIFLASVLITFGLPTIFSSAAAVILTVLICYLVWSAIGRQISRGIIRSYMHDSAAFPHPSEG